MVKNTVADPGAAARQDRPEGQSRRRNPEAARKDILAAATALFARLGYHGVTVSRVAAEAGVSKGLVHHHFETKESLYLAVIKCYNASVAGRFRAHMEPPLVSLETAQAETSDGAQPPEGLRRAVVNYLEDTFHGYFGFLQDTPEYVRMAIWMNVFTQDRPFDWQRLMEESMEDVPMTEDLAFMLAFSEGFVDRMRLFQDQGVVRPELDPLHMLNTAVGIIEFWFESHNRIKARFSAKSAERFTNEAFKATALDIFCKGVLTETPPIHIP